MEFTALEKNMEILTDKISLKSHQFSNINGEGSINTISLFSSGFMNEIPLAEGLRLMPKLEKNFKENHNLNHKIAEEAIYF